jgi:hypothetical protein
MSAMNQINFEVGKVYYRLHRWAYPPGAHVISTWVYAGEGSDACADNEGCEALPPGFSFIEWEAWIDIKNSNETCTAPSIGFQSRVRAEEAMLTWDELLQRLLDLNRFELHNRQFTVLAETEEVTALARVRIIATSANPQEETFSIRGQLIEGTPEPKRAAVVMLDNKMWVTFHVIKVECVKGTDKDLITLACRGSIEDVEAWSNLALEGRQLDVLKLKRGVWIESADSDSG